MPLHSDPDSVDEHGNAASSQDISGELRSDQGSEDRLALSGSSAENQATNVEGLDRDVLKLVNTVPPELLRGTYSSVPGTRAKRGLDRSLPPITDIETIFDDLAIKASRNGIDKFLEHIGSRELRVATMCSGTESPLLALEMLAKSFRRLIGKTFRMHHLFSAEIDSFKQSYIQRNFSPDIIFRDVNELVADEATTAFGSLREVPSNPDMLIVGFSCVDFSQLNLYRKTLEQMGESGHTFFAVLRYMDKCRPALVVLENVSGAPWKRIEEALRQIGYEGYSVKIDTKNYYLPQTRERGYMFCVDQRTLVTEPQGEAQSSSFARMMKQLQRAASSPVTQFLLKQGDPRLRAAIDDMSVTTTQDRQAVDWTRYKARHLAYRMREGLGNKRPLTKWQDNGTCKMPDFYWHGWSRGQTERVWDTLDVNFLRTLIRGYDINFKSRVIDLSQGLDRELDQRASGVSGCLTPRGQHFITSRGGPLLGIEALALQGIPIDRLLLSNDSQRDLHDLAGNAMSSTVVGSAMLSALILGHTALPPGPTPSNDPDATPATTSPCILNHAHTMMTAPVESPAVNSLSPTDIIDRARRSSRLCLCEGQTLSKPSGLLRCSKCGHTACENCGQSRSHAYESISKQELRNRIAPADFERQLKAQLPMRLELNGLSPAIFEPFREQVLSYDAPSAWDKFMSMLTHAMRDEFRFSGVTRQRTWTVTYENSRCILNLSCLPSSLRWAFYILPNKDEPSNSPLRQILLRPVAWMVPSGDSLLNGMWRISSPLSSKFDVVFRGLGERVESLGSRAGLQHPDFRNSTVWDQLSVSMSVALARNLEFDVSGNYELLQDCGAANGSLHRKISAGTSDTIYFFLDPTEIGPPEFDSWVFAVEHDRLDFGQIRDTIAEIRPNWSAFRLKDEPQTVSCWYRESVECPDLVLSDYAASEPASYRVLNLNQVTVPENIDCKQSFFPLLHCSVPATGDQSTWDRGVWHSSNLTESSEMLQKFAWLLQRATSVTDFERWTVIDPENRELNVNCDLCAPERPRLMWALDERDRIYPYEDHQEAANYEKSIKNRPAILMGHTVLEDDSSVSVWICLNIATLLHQAIGKLGKALNPSLKWRLCMDSTGFIRPRLPKLRPLNNKEDVQHAQPPGFKRFPLRPEQLRSLTWMVRQEEESAEPFEEEEVVEVLLPVINWRVEGRAATKNVVRGGILGDDVGYGKTAISLGLIDVQLQEDSNTVPDFLDGRIPIKATLIVVPHHLFDQWSREITKFLHSKYRVLELKTLSPLNNYTISKFGTVDIVLMSASLLRGGAYYGRMKTFAGAPEVPKGDGRIFEAWLGDTMVGIRDHTNLLMNEGGPAVLDSIVRKREALQNGEGLSKYKPSRRLKGQKLQEYLAKLRQDTANEGEDEKGNNSGSAPTGARPRTLPHSSGDKRKRGKASKERASGGPGTDECEEKGAKAKGRATKETDNNAASMFCLQDAKYDWKRLRSPLIHMFEFNRLIIDEFTYSKDRNYTSSLTIPARKKWILSGTPPLNDFADVKSFAPFLGVNLGVDEEDSPRSDNERLKVMQRERTDAEQFQPFVTRRSAAWHQRRHDLAQGFLDRFMRKNEPDIGEIPFTEHICGVVLSPEERAVYLELFMQLMTQNLRIRRHGRGLFDSAEAARLDAMIGNSEGPQEALLKRSCLFSFPSPANSSNQESLQATEDQEGSGAVSEAEEPRHDDNEKAVDPVPPPGQNHPENPPVTDSYQTLLDIRTQELIHLAKDIMAKLKQGFYLKAHLQTVDPDFAGNLQFDTLIEKIGSHEFGDWLVTLQTQTLVDRAKVISNPENDASEFYLSANEKKQNPRDTRTEPPRTRAEIISGLNYCTDSLRRLIHETVTRTRAARLFQAVRSFQEANPDALFGCTACRTNDSNPKALYLLGECGHSVCGICLERCQRDEQCLYPYCGGTVQPYRVIKWSDLGHDEPMPVNDEWLKFNSSKNAELVKLLQDTEKIPEDDQVVLFVQFPELIQGACAALELANVPHKVVTSSDRTADNAITEFQTGAEKVKSRVLVMALGDVTASGLNLQNANHIIFYSPLLARSQYDYESGMAQAIGRCRRYGQQNHVHIYNFMTLKTIEVNIFEQRRSEQVVMRDGKFLSTPRSAIQRTDALGWTGFSLEGTNAETYDGGYNEG